MPEPDLGDPTPAAEVDAEGVSVHGAHSWRVLLRTAAGQVVGAGVLVDPWHVLTCAHVVSRGLGEPPGGGLPEGELIAVLPFGDSGNGVDRAPVDIAAVVHPHGWAPPSARGGGDLALLRLAEGVPAGYRTARLARRATTHNRGVLVFGHPQGLDDGVWARTRVTGIGGPAGEWLQLDAAHPTGRPITPGFSGAGALDETTGEVLGIVVAQDPDLASRVAWVIRVETMTGYLPYLAALLGRPELGAPAGAAATDRRRSPVGERHPVDVHGHELFDRLWAVPGMTERRERDRYLQSLDQRLVPGSLPVRPPDDWVEVWDLAHSLVAQPGALRELVAVLRRFHPWAAEVDALEEYVERTYPDLLLDHGERSRLESLLRDVPATWVTSAMNSATARLGLPPVVGHRSLPDAVRELEGYGRTRGGPAPPLIIFVDDLAHAYAASDRNLDVELHLWIRLVAQRLGVPRTLIDHVCAHAQQRRRELAALSLMVHLDPDRSDPDRYYLSVLLMHHDRTERVLHRDDLSRTLAEISQELDDVLASVPAGLDGESQDPMIEFVLPRQLLGEPVDEWEVGHRAFPLPLGLRYPVVVRSRERMLQATYRASWRDKSRRLRETGHQTTLDAVHCVTPPDRLSEQSPTGAATALYARLVDRDSVVCLAVPYPPDSTVPASADPFAAGLAAGVPAMLWPRDQVDPDLFFQLAVSGLADVPMEIPQRVLSHRRALAGGSTPDGLLAARVGVLFDVADRAPQQFRDPVHLQAPR